MIHHPKLGNHVTMWVVILRLMSQWGPFTFLHTVLVSGSEKTGPWMDMFCCCFRVILWWLVSGSFCDYLFQGHSQGHYVTVLVSGSFSGSLCDCACFRVIVWLCLYQGHYVTVLVSGSFSGSLCDCACFRVILWLCLFRGNFVTACLRVILWLLVSG